MGKSTNPSPRKRGKVEALLKLNTFSQRDVAKKVGLSQKAVHTVKKRLDEGLTSSPKCSTSGWKSSLTACANQVLLKECRKNRKMTSKQL